MIIKNKKNLGNTGKRKIILKIAEKAVEAVMPGNALFDNIAFNKKSKILEVCKKKYSLSGKRIFIVGGGKASGLMAQAIENIVGVKNIKTGVINTNNLEAKTKKIKLVKASHPIPNNNGVEGVKKMLELKTKYNIKKDDVVLCLISGGGSALMPFPARGLNIGDKKKTTDLLLKSGAGIHEINAVRKHLSGIKGGRLGKYFYPATVISIIISDVVGNNLDVIASGPTVKDSSTFEEAKKIFKKYRLFEKIPKRVKRHIEKGLKGELEETPKKLLNCSNHIVICNNSALEAARQKADFFALSPKIITDSLTGAPGKAAKQIAKDIKKGKYKKYHCLIFGGETTPALPKKSGKGGRNMHFIASLAKELKNFEEDWCALSIGTDGSDYIRGIAGAVVSSEQFKNNDLNNDLNTYLKHYDTYNFFKKISNSLVETGDTGTNVGDIATILI